MEPKQPGNKQMPDFQELTDRMIAEKPSSPMLVIKTNLDPKDSTENNPYYRHNDPKDPNAFKDYFEK
jgi:hypothetical protein